MKREKHIILTIVLILTLTLTSRAQIFLQDGETDDRATADPGLYVDLPNGYGYGVDWYTPTGSGVLLLTALGGAYLLNKRKKTDARN